MENVLVKSHFAPIAATSNRELSLELKHVLEHSNGQDLEDVLCCAWVPVDPEQDESKHPILASVGKGGLRVWKKEADSFVTLTHIRDPAVSCEWSVNGDYLAVGCGGATVTIWQHDTACSGVLDKLSTIALPATEKEVITLSWKYFQGYNLLLFGTKDGSIAVIKVASGATNNLAWFTDNSNNPLQFVEWLSNPFSSDDSHVFLYGGFNSLELVRFGMQAENFTFTRITDISGEAHTGSVFGATFCEADPSSFFTWGSDRKLKPWSITARPTDKSHTVLRTPNKLTDLVGSRPTDKMVNAVDWTSRPFKDLEDNYVAVAHEDRSITLYCMNPAMVDNIFYDIVEAGLVSPAHKRSVTCIRWFRGSPDKQLHLASASRDGTVKVWVLQKSKSP